MLGRSLKLPVREQEEISDEKGGGFMEIWNIFSPVLLHFVVSEIVGVMAAGRVDTATATLLASLAVLPFAVRMYQRDRGKNTTRTKESKRTERVLLGVFCLLAGAAANLIWSGVLSTMRIQEAFSNAAQEALLASSLPAQIFSLVILAPVTEELIFRGLVYRRMRRILPAGISVLLSALVFSLYHGNVIQAVFALPMALVLGILMEKKKNLLFPVLFHVGANLAAVLPSFF